VFVLVVDHPYDVFKPFLYAYKYRHLYAFSVYL
jgi:hypothetical protein